ncbi:MAG TPA: hypothetical protein VGP93_05485, partial [Polyangiaceae bacterium]|nr:hypothetical protein [Polyangiaceae bacterium]
MERRLSLREKLLPRLSSALLGSALGTVLVAALDASLARSSSRQAGFGALFAADMGLVAPLSLGLGLLAAVFAVLFLPRDFPRRITFADPAGTFEKPAESAWRWLILPPASALAILVEGRIALRILASAVLPSALGAALALTATILAA